MDVSPRTYRFLPADILLTGYRIVGKVMVINTGVMGLMNDPNNSSMEVHDGRMARVHMPTKLVDHFEQLRMMKLNVVAVCMSRREDLGPQALVRGGYTQTVEYSVRLTTQMYEIDGTMELPGRFDFHALMTDGSREFLPVFNVTLTGILFPNLRIDSPGILINRRKVELMALINQRAKPENP
jgi:hypothetical protein